MLAITVPPGARWDSGGQLRRILTPWWGEAIRSGVPTALEARTERRGRVSRRHRRVESVTATDLATGPRTAIGESPAPDSGTARPVRSLADC